MSINLDFSGLHSEDNASAESLVTGTDAYRGHVTRDMSSAASAGFTTLLLT